MKIGDRVALRDIPENDEPRFRSYKGLVGEIINHDHGTPPTFLRISFDGRLYEDMLVHRVMLL